MEIAIDVILPHIVGGLLQQIYKSVFAADLLINCPSFTHQIELGCWLLV